MKSNTYKAVLFCFFSLMLSLLLVWPMKGYAQVPVPLGHGVRTYGSISAMDFDSINGRLYMGGYFENMGGKEANNIAMWDGLQWHNLGSGIAGQLTSIKCLNGKVYVGGSFNDAGGVAVTNIAMWDGNQWHSMGSNPITTYAIMSLESFNNEIYLAAFLNICSPPAVGVAKWDGTSWSCVATTDSIYASIKLLNCNDSLLIYGSFATINGLPYTNAASFDGTTFHDLSISLSTQYSKLVSAVPYQNTIYALEGNGQLYHLGSSGWLSDSVVTGFGNLLFVCSDSLYTLDEVSGWPNGDTLQIWNIYNGSKYRKIATIKYPFIQITEYVNCAREYNGNLLIGGQFSNVNTNSLITSAIYNGNNWSQFAGASVRYGGPWVNANASTFAYDSVNGDLYVGGSFYFAGDSIANNVARWDGSNWYPVGKGLNNFVYKLIFYHDTLYAGGRFTRSGTNQVSRFARFNGTDWEQIGSGSDGTVRDMIVFNNKLYVAGYFSQINGVSAEHIVHYNGSIWQQVGNTGLDDDVVSLAVYNNQLAAAANFNFTLGTFPNYTYTGIVSLSGNNWIALPGSSSVSLSRLLKINTDFYGCDDTEVYKFNGSAWVPTGFGSWPPKNPFILSINNKLMATAANDGMYELDSVTWKPFQIFIQAYAAFQTDSSHIILGGFFPEYFDGLSYIPLYNVATLELTKPIPAFTQDRDSICDHQYISFATPGSTYPVTYEWFFPGGIPSASISQLPIIKYSFPGDYDVYLKETNPFGSDSIYKISTVHVALCTAGINEKNEPVQLFCFPNPAKDYFYISSKDPLISFQLFNLTGQCCKEGKAEESAGIAKIDCSGLSSGLYILRITTTHETVTRKMIIE